MEPALPPDDPDLGSRVVDLRPRRFSRRIDELEERVLRAEEEARVLRERLAAQDLVRDHLLDRLAASEAGARRAEQQARAARQQLTERLAGEVRALARARSLEGQLAAARAAGDEGRDAELTALAAELAQAAQVAREDVERHLAARAGAEQRLLEGQRLLEVERARAAEVVAVLRAELEALRGAHEQAVVAEARTRAAQREDLERLAAETERMAARDPSVADAADGVIVDLARASDRLRSASEALVDMPLEATVDPPAVTRPLTTPVAGPVMGSDAVPGPPAALDAPERRSGLLQRSRIRRLTRALRRLAL